jgi:hypothetical protein
MWHNDMTAHSVPRHKTRGETPAVFTLPFVLLIVLVAAATAFVSYVLWPTWKGASMALAAPEIPITVAGVVFDVPPAAIRAAVQRQPGPHERIDLAFLWPSLLPPQLDGNAVNQPTVQHENAGAAPLTASEPLFVTIAALGTVLPPAQRLRTIYPQYVEAQAAAGPDGLAILPFRAGTPYEGEDLIYLAAAPDQFFTRCTRQTGVVPGTCIHERTIDAAEITLRYPRQWLDDWRGVVAGFDRLMTQLHPQNEGGLRTTDDR